MKLEVLNSLVSTHLMVKHNSLSNIKGLTKSNTRENEWAKQYLDLGNSMVCREVSTFTKNASGKVSTNNTAQKTQWKYRALNLRKVKFLVVVAMLSVNLK